MRSGFWCCRRVALAFVGLAFASLAAAEPKEAPPAASSAGERGPTVEIPIRYTPIIVSEVFSGSIVRVVDDRTIVIRRDNNHRNQTVRLYGVRPLGEGGKPARAYLEDQLRRARIRVECRSREPDGDVLAVVTPLPPKPSHLLAPRDPSQITTETGPRTAAAPASATPQESLNASIIRLGLAAYDARQDPGDTALAGAETEAQQQRRGAWADASPKSIP